EGHAVQQHRTLLRVVQPQQQLGQRALARAALAHHRRDLVGGQEQVQALEHPLARAGGVGEVHAPELDLALHTGRLGAPRADGRLPLHQLQEPLNVRELAVEQVVVPLDAADEIQHLLEHEEEAGQPGGAGAA
ncbi:unnamed protein product, partial [Heterosigma akashiwo]